MEYERFRLYSVLGMFYQKIVMTQTTLNEFNLLLDEITARRNNKGDQQMAPLH